MITSCAPIPFIRSNSPSPWRSRLPSTCSAGNLFGTTRKSQPDEFGAVPFCRNANTSGGVISSWPGQKGQYCSPITVGRSRRKSLGRLRRSVEMITQRPVTGSFRSSGNLFVDVHQTCTLHDGCFMLIQTLHHKGHNGHKINLFHRIRTLVTFVSMVSYV